MVASCLDCYIILVTSEKDNSIGPLSICTVLILVLNNEKDTGQNVVTQVQEKL